MKQLFIIWIFMLVTSQLSSAIILRPKWFPYFARANQGGSERVGSDGAHLYDSSRSADTVTSREARTVDIVNMDNDVFRANWADEDRLPEPSADVGRRNVRTGARQTQGHHEEQSLDLEITDETLEYSFLQKIKKCVVYVER
ncbi:hypothetical protein RRG08_041585 [Elysia crispata]|uniref:Uncharacterized protein n=1 Tax=Elysia crispata TaxID=231223 RepID=A0AAE1AY83_9GAST|nr:hypothetical protein RRG08_041585 [Elysia crispata]